MDLPPQLLARARAARAIVELAAGKRFDIALALHAANPELAVLVTDRDAAVLTAPEPLVALVDDLHAPRVEAYGAPDLLYAMRLPEELQLSAAKLARRLGASLALRPLKDEWAELRPHVVELERWGGGWRLFGAR